jgi:serine/threonine protein kinase
LQCCFKLADFGLAKLLTPDAQGEHYAKTRVGTPNYMAPEISSNWRKYSFGADIFSLGCILVFFANRGKHLFYSQEEIQKWAGMAREDDVIRPGYSADLVRVVGNMLEVEHTARPTAKEVRDLCTMARMQVKPRSSYTDPDDPDLFESLQPTIQ